MLIQKPPNLHQFNSSNQNLSTRIVLKLAAFSVSSLLEVKLHGRTLLPLKQTKINWNLAQTILSAIFAFRFYHVAMTRC